MNLPYQLLTFEMINCCKLFCKRIFPFHIFSRLEIPILLLQGDLEIPLQEVNQIDASQQTFAHAQKTQAGFRSMLNIYIGHYFFICRVCLVLLTIKFRSVSKNLITNHCNSAVSTFMMLLDDGIEQCKHKQEK